MWMIVFISYLWNGTYYCTIELISVSDCTLVSILMLLFLFTWNLLSKNTVMCSYCRYIIHFHRHCKRTCTVFWQRCSFDLLIWQCYASRHHAGNTVFWYFAWSFVCLEVCNSLFLWQGSINGFLCTAEVGKLNIIFCSHRHVHTKYLK